MNSTEYKRGISYFPTRTSLITFPHCPARHILRTMHSPSSATQACPVNTPSTTTYQSDLSARRITSSCNSLSNNASPGEPSQILPLTNSPKPQAYCTPHESQCISSSAQQPCSTAETNSSHQSVEQAMPHSRKRLSHSEARLMCFKYMSRIKDHANDFCVENLDDVLKQKGAAVK